MKSAPYSWFYFLSQLWQEKYTKDIFRAPDFVFNHTVNIMFEYIGVDFISHPSDGLKYKAHQSWK